MLRSDQVNDRRRGAVAVENLSLSEHNMLLEIHCHGLSGAEIFHCLRNLDPQLLADAEECVDGVPCRENYCRKVQNIQSLCTELPRSQGFYEKKWFEVYLYSELFNKRIIRGLVHRSLL